jgi:hypothetical protein
MRKHTQVKGYRAVTDDEVAQVSQAFRGTYAARERARFVLGVKTGFGVSEFLSLRIGDLWQHGQFMERVAVSRRYMRGRIEGRGVTVHAEVKAALTAWLMAMRRKGAVSTETYFFPEERPQ